MSPLRIGKLLRLIAALTGCVRIVLIMSRAETRSALVPSTATITPRELSAHWREQAIEFRRYGAEAQAKTLERAAHDLEIALGVQNDELLTLKEAAAESGFNADHLGREVARGRIPNAGRKHAPRIRRGDLPRKNAALSGASHAAYPNRAEIARAVVTRHAAGDD